MKKIMLLIAFLLFILTAAGCKAKDSGTKDEDAVNQAEENQSTQEGKNTEDSQSKDGGQADGTKQVGDGSSAGAESGLSQFKATEEKVNYLLGQMTLEEKVGQMLQGANYKVTAGEMTKLGLGSVLSGGGGYPGKNTLSDWRRMIKSYQAAALKTKNKIPMLYGLDAVHGLAVVKNAVVFPQNIGIGAANDPELTYQMGAAVAEEMKLINVIWNFSPCVAVSTDPRWGRTYESYSSDPQMAAALADAYLKGQTDHGVLATAKHYVGDGGAEWGTGEGNNLIDRGDCSITEEELRATHLVPYKKLVDSGVQIIMASFSSFNGVKMHENKYFLTDVLKTEFGFKGFIVSDWEATLGLSGGSYEENLILAINAGVDMLMESNNYAEAAAAITDAVNTGKITKERIDDAVGRILTVKLNSGLFDDPYLDNIKREVTELGNAGYRDIAKKLVEKSMVLLKNENNTLPLKKGQKIYVTGPAVNDMGMQCGGWGLTWQGILDNERKVTEGTTILDGLKEYAAKYGYEIITDESKASEADIVILGIGEIPYAEYTGDTQDLSITGALAHPGNKEAMDYAESLNKPIITLLIAGRNVLINDYIKDWDSVVMCYLPGSEGNGIASVLSGETPFTGKLAMPYYKSTADIGKNDVDLMFEAGYGLTY